MAKRVRTTKKLAQRIDMNYFKYPHPLRRWRFWLSVAAAAAALVWVVWAGVAGEKKIYSSGPVSEPHAIFGHQCGVCHMVPAGAFREHATDTNCLACHDGPIHQVRQTGPMPECGSCHVEHKGAKRLAAVDDKSCSECHAELQQWAVGHSTSFVRNVSSFDGNHPEFAPLREKRKDPGTIKLNHQAHLKAGMRSPRGPAELQCNDCHRPPSAREPWAYGEAQFRTVSSTDKEKTQDPLAPVPNRAYMVPVKYAQSCAACHQLQFDPRIEASVPHDKPEVVHDFVVTKFREYLAKNPGAWRVAERPAQRIPGKPVEVRPAARSPEEWLRERVADAENLLWGKTCKECHTLSTPAGATLPVVAKANMTVRWLPHAKFDHEAHRMMDCNSCHAAKTSRETADVLLPSIQLCRDCHQPQGAESRCFECHSYHDWSHEKRIKGKFTIPELLRTARPAPYRSGTGPAPQPAAAGQPGGAQ